MHLSVSLNTRHFGRYMIMTICNELALKQILDGSLPDFPVGAGDHSRLATTDPSMLCQFKQTCMILQKAVNQCNCIGRLSARSLNLHRQSSPSHTASMLRLHAVSQRARVQQQPTIRRFAWSGHGIMPHWLECDCRLKGRQLHHVQDSQQQLLSQV